MAETIVINQQTPTNSNESGSSLFFGLITKVIVLFLILALIAAGVAIYYLVDNWNYIAAFFTTGIIGYLNPFDDSEGDAPLGAIFTRLPGVGLIFRLFD